MGYYSADRWVSSSGDRTHEIALNPLYFGNHKLIEIFQTMVHEMCHLWQHENRKPSRNGYHNSQWARKMVSLGLIPSSTGMPGGQKTGQKISDYPEPNGRFIKVCKDLFDKGSQLPWVDRYTATSESSQIRFIDDLLDDLLPGIESLLQTPLSNVFPDLYDSQELALAAKAKQKSKYSCLCGTNVWGKPGLVLICGDCQEEFEEIE